MIIIMQRSSKPKKGKMGNFLNWSFLLKQREGKISRIFTFFEEKKRFYDNFSFDIFPASSHSKDVQDHPSYHLLIYYIVINFYPNESCILLLKYIIITWPSLWMFIVFFTRPSGVCSLVESTCIYILCLSPLKITRPSKLCETQLFRL